MADLTPDGMVTIMRWMARRKLLKRQISADQFSQLNADLDSLQKERDQWWAQSVFRCFRIWLAIHRLRHKMARWMGFHG